MNKNKLHDDYIEIVARALLFKQREGEFPVTTDDWQDYYVNGGYNLQYNRPVSLNTFKYQVDTVVAQLMVTLAAHGG
jgi:hypothetical protein